MEPIWIPLGWAYYKQGKYEQSEELLLKASQHMGSDPTVQDHLGDLYQKTGRLKLAAAHWERAVNEWNNKTVAVEADPDDSARVQKKLESAKMKLAKEENRQAVGSSQNQRAIFRPPATTIMDAAAFVIREATLTDIPEIVAATPRICTRTRAAGRVIARRDGVLRVRLTCMRP